MMIINGERNQISPDPVIIKKRAKTTRKKQKRSRTTDRNRDGETPDGPLNIAKICKIPEEREVLHKETKVMSNAQFEIEISMTDDRMYIGAVRVDRIVETYLIELDKDKGKEIMSEFKDDYKEVIFNLQILKRRLVLLNPNLAENRKPKKSKKKKSGKGGTRRMKGSQSQPTIPQTGNDEKPAIEPEHTHEKKSDEERKENAETAPNDVVDKQPDAENKSQHSDHNESATKHNESSPKVNVKAPESNHSVSKDKEPEEAKPESEKKSDKNDEPPKLLLNLESESKENKS